MKRIVIEQFNPERSSKRLLRRVAALYSEVEQELRPDQPAPSTEEYVAHLRNVSKYRAALRWLARKQSGEVVGCSYLGFKLVPENPTAARIDVLVTKPYRRRKVGTSLLEPLVSAARTRGREQFTCTSMEDSSGAHFLTSIGARHRAQAIENHLDLTSVEERSLKEILSKYHGLHEHYTFVSWENTCPTHLVKDLANAKMLIYEAPRGKRRKEIWRISPEWIREEEAQRLQKGLSWVTMAAIGREAPRIVAFTDVLFSAHRPWIAMQEDTAVDPAHRRRGLASILKARLILKIRGELPNIRILSAINGSDNLPILRINHRLGFIPKYRLSKWEIDLARLTVNLGRDGSSRKNSPLPSQPTM